MSSVADPDPYYLIRIRIPDQAQLLIRIRIREMIRIPQIRIRNTGHHNALSVPVYKNISWRFIISGVPLDLDNGPRICFAFSRSSVIELPTIVRSGVIMM